MYIIFFKNIFYLGKVNLSSKVIIFLICGNECFLYF